ncbi:ribosome recycling factor [bacterium]|nr:ribosome recycling factor [bacterium]
MIDDILDDARQRMEKTLVNTHSELGKIRTGRASLSLLDTVRVNYYNSMVPLKQVANLGIPEPRMITIQPWDRNLLGEIEKAILKTDLGITPNNDGHIIRLPIPPLTEERRQDLVRLIHQLGEENRIAVRNIRRDVIDHLRKAQKEHQISEDEEYNGGIDIQKITDEYIKKIDEVISKKEVEIMEV